MLKDLTITEKKELQRLEFFKIEIPQLMTKEDIERMEFLKKKRFSET